MRWTSRGFSVPRNLVCLILIVLPARSAEEKRLVVYAPHISYSIPVVERNGVEYCGLVEVLEPLCGVSAGMENKLWKLRCDKIPGQFKPGVRDAFINGRPVVLADRFLVENDRGLAPLHSLDTLSAMFLNQPAQLHAVGHRLFIGDVAIHFTPELRKDALVLNFSAPVNPVISTEPGRIKLTFYREAVISPASNFRYDNPLVSSLTYSESNGHAELSLATNTPLLASFGDQGKTITLAVAPTQSTEIPARSQQTAPQPVALVGIPTPVAPPQAPPAPAGASVPSAMPTAAPGIPPKAVSVVVLDPSHGGDERGAALSDHLAEKDVTLAFARRLRAELQVRGVPTLMSRDGDATLSSDERATLANTSPTLLFVTIHAGALGHGVHIYTAMLPLAETTTTAGSFLAWDVAQASFLSTSHTVAEQLSGELSKHEISSSLMTAPVRPLNNIAAPAIALELAPPGNQIDALSSTTYQQSVAAAIATAIFVARPQLETAQNP